MAEATVKQRKFVAELLKGKSNGAAALAAGYSEDYGSDLVKSPTIQGLLATAMAKAGIDDNLIARKLREGLDAKTPPRKEGGQQYPDQFVRKQFLDVIFKLRGDYAPEKAETVHKTINITIDKGMIEAWKDTGFITGDQDKILEAEVVETKALEAHAE